MSQRITIDPVTRIEGHLRIDVEVDGGRVKNAWSSGTMWRGIETILQGRDPREAWLFTQRYLRRVHDRSRHRLRARRRERARPGDPARTPSTSGT